MESRKQSSFYNFISGNTLSRKSYFLFFMSLATTRWYSFSTPSTIVMALFSIFVGEYMTTPSNRTSPFVNSKKRYLGFTETVLHNRYKKSAGASNVGAILQVTGTLHLKNVEETLKKLMSTHPLLRATISEENGISSIEHSSSSQPTLPLLILNKTNDESSKQHLEKILDLPFPQDSNFLWEIIVMENHDRDGTHDILLKAHHCILDGISIAIFMEQFMNIYNRVAEPYLEMPFLKAHEDFVTPQTNWTRYLVKHILDEVWATIFPEGPHQKKCRMHESGPLLFSARHTKLSFAHFTHEELCQLISQCRKNKTTLTALLTAALLQATRQVFGNLIIETIDTPVSVRQNFSKNVTDGDHLGCYVAGVKIRIPVKNTDTTWDLAQLYRENLLKYMPVIYPANFIPSSWKVAIMSSATLSTKPQFSSGIGVSSLGSRDFINRKDYAELQLKNFYFCSSKRYGAKIMAIYAAQAGGKLDLCFAHPDKLVNENNAEKIKELTMQILKNILKHGNCLHEEKQFSASNLIFSAPDAPASQLNMTI